MCKAFSDATTTACSRHPATGRRHNWHCDVHCEAVMNPNASKPIDGLKTTTFEHQLNMRTNDTSSVPKEALSVSLTIPSKTSACNVGCHAQSTLRGGSENDIRARTSNAELKAISEARESFYCQLLCLPLLLPSRGTNRYAGMGGATEEGHLLRTISAAAASPTQSVLLMEVVVMVGQALRVVPSRAERVICQTCSNPNATA